MMRVIMIPALGSLIGLLLRRSVQGSVCYSTKYDYSFVLQLFHRVK